MTRTLTGFKPTGHLHLGNLLGAVQPLARASRAAVREGRPADDVVALVCDLHALTVSHDPAALPALTREAATVLLAAGVDPRGALVVVQSRVREHRALHYLLEAVTTYGEATRMIQFKEKATDGDSTRLALLTYPVLMAADILVYGTGQVPVGDDQRQHLELARTIARRFNRRYGDTFVLPQAAHQRTGRRLMDLTDPTRKMGKTGTAGAGVLFVLDSPDTVRRKVSRAVTDTVGEVRYDVTHQPGVANLLELVAACTDTDPAYLATGLSSYAELKECVAETVVGTLAPVQARYAELVADPAYVDAVLDEGTERARALAGDVVERAEAALGLHRVGS